MYISGVPGTGKTATVTLVVDNLKRLAANRHVHKFDYVNINGMRLSEPRQSYVEVSRTFGCLKPNKNDNFFRLYGN